MLFIFDFKLMIVFSQFMVCNLNLYPKLQDYFTSFFCDIGTKIRSVSNFKGVYRESISRNNHYFHLKTIHIKQLKELKKKPIEFYQRIINKTIYYNKMESITSIEEIIVTRTKKHVTLTLKTMEGFIYDATITDKDVIQQLSSKNVFDVLFNQDFITIDYSTEKYYFFDLKNHMKYKSETYYLNNSLNLTEKAYNTKPFNEFSRSKTVLYTNITLKRLKRFYPGRVFNFNIKFFTDMKFLMPNVSNNSVARFYDIGASRTILCTPFNPYPRNPVKPRSIADKEFLERKCSHKILDIIRIKKEVEKQQELVNMNGKTYISKINENTTTALLTDDDFVQGCLDRGPGKKDYYLPLLDKNYKYTSGLMCISKQEYDDMCNEGDVFYIKVVKILYSKVIIIFYHPDTYELPLKKKLEMVFDAVGLDLKNMPNMLYPKKCIPMLQHILSIILKDKVFTFTELQEFAGMINCDSYKNTKITILCFIELHIARINLIQHSIEMPYGQIYFVNPDNLHVVPGFSNTDSILQTGQCNADIMIRVYNPITNTYKNIYIDVKTFSSFSFKPRNLMSIWFFNIKDYYKEFSNLKTTLQKEIKNTTDLKRKKFLEEIMRIMVNIKENTNLEEEQKLIKIHALLLKLTINKDILLGLNYPLIETNNKIQQILNNIMHRLEERYNNDNLVSMFPSNTQLDNRMRVRFMRDFIRNHFQDDSELMSQIALNAGIDLNNN